MNEYIGRRRQAPQCQFGFDGCEGTGTEILDPYKLEVDDTEEIVVACASCERELTVAV